MTYKIIGKSVLTLEHEIGETKSVLKSVDFNIDVSANIDRKQYVDAKTDLPNGTGVRSLTLVFVKGLVGNIKHADAKGFWKKSEHIQYVLKEIGRALEAETELTESNFDE
jgi:hypothetical protein